MNKLLTAGLGLLALVGLAFVAQGCASDRSVAATTQAPPGYVVQDDDDVSREYPVTVDQARRAIELTMQELQMTNIAWDQESDHLEIEADTAADEDFEVEIRSLGASRTVITVDFEGDFERAKAIDFHERLQRHLQTSL